MLRGLPAAPQKRFTRVSSWEKMGKWILGAFESNFRIIIIGFLKTFPLCLLTVGNHISDETAPAHPSSNAVPSRRYGLNAQVRMVSPAPSGAVLGGEVRRVGPHLNISVSLQERDGVTIKQSARTPGFIGQDRGRRRFLQ